MTGPNQFENVDCEQCDDGEIECAKCHGEGNSVTLAQLLASLYTPASFYSSVLNKKKAESNKKKKQKVKKAVLNLFLAPFFYFSENLMNF